LKAKNCGIIIIGNEILEGYVQDVNSGWIARKLNGLGFDVKKIFVVGDVVKDIVETLNLALNLRLNLIFVCGGLGGTPDDKTVKALSKCFNLKLIKDETIHDKILRKIDFLKKRNVKVEPSKWLFRMAYIPEKSVPLKNSLGLAPGIMLKHKKDTVIFVLPGVPVEMKTIFSEEIEPRLGFGEKRLIREINLKTEETRFSGIVDRLEKEHKKVTIGMYPHLGKLQLTIRIIGQEKEVLTVTEKILSTAEKLGVKILS